MKLLYPAKITFDKADERYLVTFLDFPEAATEGVSLDEALFNAAELLTLTLEGRVDEKIEVPLPSTKKGKQIYSISPSARVQAALLIRFLKGEHTIAEVARALETSWPSVARLEDPHHWPSLKQLERTAGAIGHKLVLSFEPIQSSSLSPDR